MWTSLREDLYMVHSGSTTAGDKVVLQVYRNPLVAWIWIGSFVMVFGTVLAMIPNMREKRSEVKAKARERTEVAA